MSLSLEQQVCSLPLAKRLKELGVKQESVFHWIKSIYLNDREETVLWSCWEVEYEKPNIDVLAETDNWSAFTVAELGEMLPQRVSSYRYEKWTCTMTSPSEMVTFTANTEADARAKMLVYLIEKVHRLP